MNLSTSYVLLAALATSPSYDYERIGPVKVDWLGLILVVLLVIAIARSIHAVIKGRAARRSQNAEK